MDTAFKESFQMRMDAYVIQYERQNFISGMKIQNLYVTCPRLNISKLITHIIPL